MSGSAFQKGYITESPILCFASTARPHSFLHPGYIFPITLNKTPATLWGFSDLCQLYSSRAAQLVEGALDEARATATDFTLF